MCREKYGVRGRGVPSVGLFWGGNKGIGEVDEQGGKVFARVEEAYDLLVVFGREIWNRRGG